MGEALHEPFDPSPDDGDRLGRRAREARRKGLPFVRVSRVPSEIAHTTGYSERDTLEIRGLRPQEPTDELVTQDSPEEI